MPTTDEIYHRNIKLSLFLDKLTAEGDTYTLITEKLQLSDDGLGNLTIQLQQIDNINKAKDNFFEVSTFTELTGIIGTNTTYTQADLDNENVDYIIYQNNNKVYIIVNNKTHDAGDSVKVDYQCQQ